MPAEARHCTVELSTGSFVHLAHAPSLVLKRRYEREHQAPGMQVETFQRMAGTGVPEWTEVLIDVRHIVAIYPLDSRPAQPAMQIKLEALAGDAIAAIERAAVRIKQAP
jgi:hypothetical protein